MIHIIQCLCPQRHAIFATAYDPGDFTLPDGGLNPHEVAMAAMQCQIEKWLEQKVINPWCGICGSREWRYEQRATKFKTMKEAMPDMKRLEFEQLLTRASIDAAKASRN